MPCSYDSPLSAGRQGAGQTMPVGSDPVLTCCIRCLFLLAALRPQDSFTQVAVLLTLIVVVIGRVVWPWISAIVALALRYWAVGAPERTEPATTITGEPDAAKLPKAA